jgi:2-iminobutanoate/2-iminopropanoate deaminase
MKDIVRIETESAPQAIGPYSQGICAGDFVFVSGQIAIDPATSMLIDGGMASQTERVIKNISAILEAAGSSLYKVVRCDVFLSSMSNFASMNEAYDKFFSGPNKPVRTTVEVSRLPKDALVEISAIAVK